MTRPSVVRRRVVPWPAEQVSAMHDALPERYRLIATLGSRLGLRQGEIFGLSPTDFTFLAGTVEVQRQVRILAGNQLVFAPPKGRKSRSLPLPSSVAAEVNAHLAQFPPVRVSLPWLTPENVERVALPLLLTTREGGALNRNYFNGTLWRSAQKRANVEPTRDNG